MYNRDEGREGPIVWRIFGLLVLCAPIAILLPVNAYKAIFGKGVEPLADNVVMYLVLAAIALAAAFAIAASLRPTRALDGALFVIAQTIAGAAGAGILMLLLDAWDDYFSAPGIGWTWPTAGLVLGAMFGAAFSCAFSIFGGRN